MRVLIVGGGIAGQAVLEAIRERDSDIEPRRLCELSLQMRQERISVASSQQ